MDISSLNPDQQDAVLHPSGPLLVVAGAGSG
ncbi:MAG: UvrD-helicase domain-containing protein, partial [Actinomycetota bacterium]